jgi:hypothetical protein
VSAADAWAAHPDAAKAAALERAIHRGHRRLHLAIVATRREHPRDAAAAQLVQRKVSALQLYQHGLEQLGAMVEQTVQGQWLQAEQRSAGALLLVQAARWELTHLPGARPSPVASTALVSPKRPAAKVATSNAFDLPLVGVLDRFHADLRSVIAPAAPAPLPTTTPVTP